MKMECWFGKKWLVNKLFVVSCWNDEYWFLGGVVDVGKEVIELRIDEGFWVSWGRVWKDRVKLVKRDKRRGIFVWVFKELGNFGL